MRALASEIYYCASKKLVNFFQTSNGRLLLYNITNICYIYLLFHLTKCCGYAFQNLRNLEHIYDIVLDTER